LTLGSAIGRKGAAHRAADWVQQTIENNKVIDYNKALHSQELKISDYLP
jgi:hypothetical protein